MNQLNSKGKVPDCGENYCEPPVAPEALMVDHVPSAEFQAQAALDPHSDARLLVRLVQCRCCSKPLEAPVTLPCGHTSCRDCLPAPLPRANISYPNTPERQLGIVCPTCQEEYPTGECNIDVTLTKLMELIKDVICQPVESEQLPALLLEEVLHTEDGMDIDVEKAESRLPEKGHHAEYRGGRLAATFTMAANRELSYNSEVSYHTTGPHPDSQQVLDIATFAHLREVALKEMDCLVCYNMMLDPTTTACGHTFCRRCLIRVMDHSDICPVCRRGLHLSPSLQNYPGNARLVSLLNSLCPDLIEARAEALRLEEQPAEDAFDTPLFICTLSLPDMPTFLHIFEPRYRLMMRRCWEGNRRFGMVMYNRASTPQGDLGATVFLEYGTLLEIINYELLPDGRSFVETRGISRFRIRGHSMLDGYHVARVERINDVSMTEEERLESEETLAARAQAAEYNGGEPQIPLTAENFPSMLSTEDLFRRCTDFVQLMTERSAPWLSARIVQVYGDPPDTVEKFPYWFATVLPISEEEKYFLLRTTSRRERLKMVYSWIKRIQGQRW